MIFIGINPYVQQAIKGATIIGAVVFDMRKTQNGSNMFPTIYHNK